MTEPLEPRRSFDEVADLYDSIRPAYPPAMFDELFGLLVESPDVVEVGPGTGQATRDLLRRSATVHAIEIGPSMAARLSERLPLDRLRVTVGAFESVAIAPRSADAIVSATAYHWIEPDAQLDRPAAILRPDGVLAIIDLVQVESPDDRGFFSAARPIYERYGDHRHTRLPTRAEVDPPMRARLDDDHRFATVELRRYDWDQTYDADGYRRLMQSYSGTRTMDEASRNGLLDDIEALVRDEFDGVVTRPLVVAMTTARRVSDG